ncbi:hypothetical protein ACPSM1_04435 [Micromonospora chersina]|uniref:hypothetical protein n=1 Tax=Micromonospora chersina TaxID=47854 RepID=UPI003CBB2807
MPEQRRRFSPQFQAEAVWPVAVCAPHGLNDLYDEVRCNPSSGSPEIFRQRLARRCPAERCLVSSS